MAGCGSSTTDVTTGTTATTAALPASTTARVVDERGAGVSNVDVVLHERTTNRKHVLKSDAQGALVLDLLPGVYDLGLNSADPSTATCFYGPLSLPGESGSTFVLRDSGGRPAGAVFGRLLSQPGKPLAGRQVVLSPTQITSRSDPQNPTAVPSPVILQSSLDGRFEGNVGFAGPVGLDIEVYNADGTLDEFVDISTLAKPCYVELASEHSAVTNRLRSNQSDGPATAALVPQTADTLRAKLLTKFTTIVPSSDLTIFTNGLLTVDERNPGGLLPSASPGPVNIYTFPELADGAVGSPLTNNRISVSSLSALWFTQNTIQVYNSVSGVGGAYHFTSEDGQVHSLSWPGTTSYTVTIGGGGGGLFGIAGYSSTTTTVTNPIGPNWYAVSYTSSLPNINRMNCQSR